MPIIQKDGNGKIDNSVCTFSHTPMSTCPNHAECCHDCYACNSYVQYDNVRASWDRNFYLSLFEPEQFETEVINELSHTRKIYVRIHVAGDFYSVRYVQCWETIIAANPQKIFWTYTKADAIPAIAKELQELEKMPNINIVRSTFNGKKNYGSMEYITALQAEIEVTGEKCFICPCNISEKKVRCGKDCHACSVFKYVLFLEHGTKAPKTKTKKSKRSVKK